MNAANEQKNNKQEPLLEDKLTKITICSGETSECDNVIRPQSSATRSNEGNNEERKANQSNSENTKNSSNSSGTTSTDSTSTSKESTEKVTVVKAKQERKIFRPAVKMVNRIPDEILNDERLKEAMKALPENYDLEVPKTIWRIKQLNARRVALQMPEGLLMFAITLCDIIESFTEAETVILGDVTYGACCVDDFMAKILECDLLIHYGHSCLIPIDPSMGIKFLYIFVDIKLDVSHFVQTVCYNFTTDTKIALVSTVQFLTALHEASARLKKEGYVTKVPQSKPLSPGEILGCTAPSVADVDCIIYLGDGRFHLEAAMIANPTLRAYRYDPYEKKMTEEFYDHQVMREARKEAIETAKKANRFGLILGTLGRQGSPKVLEQLQKRIEELGKEYVIVLLSEITPEQLNLFGNSIDAWIQVACPRLSIDWGTNFSKPLLTPYEANVVLNKAQWTAKDGDKDSTYPMDYYADTSLGPWTPNHKSKEGCCGKNCKNKNKAL